MKTITITLAVTALLAATSGEAKTKNKAIDGCVQQREGRYELTAVSKKGKPKHYALAVDHDFSKDVGHRVRVNGVVGSKTLNAGSVHTIASSCKG
jgi:hypothetical protein